MSETSAPVVVATTETIAGHRIIHTLGYVEGKGRGAMTTQASGLGANAIVGVRWALTEGYRQDFARGTDYTVNVPLIYGTAVVIEPEAG